MIIDPRTMPQMATTRVTVTRFLQKRAVDVVLLAGAINFLWLWQNGYGNLYYATTVKSMLTSWHNFFYASFDPAGFVSIDKPPLGFWIQAASAKLLGFNSLSLLLPQALAGTLSVAVLYHLVRRAWGAPAGILAALMLALTPISVATNRNNAVDSLLVLTLLLAAWAAGRAADTGHLWPLLLSAILVGVGFNIKGLQALMVLPALLPPFLLAPSLSWRTCIAYLALAAVVLLAVSSIWIVVVDLTPSTQRPFVGSTTHDTALDLTLGFNGLNRLSYGDRLTPAVLNAQQIIGFGPGSPSTLRLLNRQLGGQIGWLLPLVVAGLLSGCRQARLRLSRLRSLQQRTLFMWGTWFLTQLVFFDGNAFFHPYYLTMFAPAVSALAGISVVALWRDYNRPGWRGWLLPVGLIGTATTQASILSAFPGWGSWLISAIAVLTILAAGILTVTRLTAQFHTCAYADVGAVVGVLALLIAPGVFATIPVWHRGNATLPFAGPDLFNSLDAQAPDDTHSKTILKLAHYLLEHRGRSSYLMATSNAVVAAPLILVTGQPVIALGGFAGKDRILTLGQFTRMVAGKSMRFILVVQPFNWLVPPFLPEQDNRQAQINRWVRHLCTPVPTRLWQVPPGFSPIKAQLYDCVPVTLRGS